MAGFTVDEGLSYIGNVLYKGATQENLTLGLFTNAPGLTQTSAWAAITQPIGTGYAEVTLVQGTFVVSAAGVVTYPQQSWTATASDWVSNGIYGYYVRNNNVSPVLVHVQYRDDGVFSMTNGKVYTVDLGIDTS